MIYIYIYVIYYIYIYIYMLYTYYIYIGYIHVYHILDICVFYLLSGTVLQDDEEEISRQRATAFMVLRPSMPWETNEDTSTIGPFSEMGISMLHSGLPSLLRYSVYL